MIFVLKEKLNNIDLINVFC